MTLNTWSSFQITQLLHLCPAKPLFHPEDVGEADKADAYPQQHTLNEWTNAHGAQCGACERRTDKEERKGDEVLGELVDGTAERRAHSRSTVADEGGIAQNVGVEDDGNDKPDNESWHAADC